MKKSKKNYVAIVLVVLLLALAVGYAAFSQTLTINGTATAKAGKWDVKFANSSITQSIVTGTATNTAVVAADGKSMDVTVNLATPGDGATITVDITNAGELDAKLKEDGFKVTGTGFTATGNSYKNDAIVVNVPNVEANHTIAAGAKKTFTFTVEWDENAEVDSTTGQTANFTITFDYEQDGITSDFTGTPAWN